MLNQYIVSFKLWKYHQLYILYIFVDNRLGIRLCCSLFTIILLRNSNVHVPKMLLKSPALPLTGIFSDEHVLWTYFVPKMSLKVSLSLHKLWYEAKHAGWSPTLHLSAAHTHKPVEDGPPPFVPSDLSSILGNHSIKKVHAPLFTPFLISPPTDRNNSDCWAKSFGQVSC